MPGLRHAHTLQQLEGMNNYFFSDYLFGFLLNFLYDLYILDYPKYMLIKYSPGGEYSSTSSSCCSVWAWRKPGIKKSWSLELENTCPTFVIRFNIVVTQSYFSSVVLCIFCSNFAVLFVIESGTRNLNLGIEINLHLRNKN